MHGAPVASSPGLVVEPLPERLQWAGCHAACGITCRASRRAAEARRWQIVAALENHGFEVIRVRGSHQYHRHRDGRATVVYPRRRDAPEFDPLGRRRRDVQRPPLEPSGRRGSEGDA